jgi:hypothetical protein
MRNRTYKKEEIVEHIDNVDVSSDRDRAATCIIKQLQDSLEKSQNKNRAYKSEVKRLNKSHIIKNHFQSSALEGLLNRNLDLLNKNIKLTDEVYTLTDDSL